MNSHETTPGPPHFGCGHDRVRVHGQGPLERLAECCQLLRRPGVRTARPGRPRPGRGRRGGREVRLGRVRHGLARGDRPGRHPDRRYLRAGVHARGNRHRRAGRRQARPGREAAGQHPRRGRGHGGGGPDRAGGRRAVHDRLQLPPGPGPGAGPGADRGGPARRRPARPRRLPAGLARGPGRAHDLAAEQGHRRVRGAGRHRQPRDRPGAVPPGRAGHRGLRPAAHLHAAAPGRCRAGGGDGRRRRLGHADPRLRGHRLGGGLPGGHRAEELAQAGDLWRQGSPAVRSGGPERARLPGRHTAGPRTGLPPDPRQRTRAPVP